MPANTKPTSAVWKRAVNRKAKHGDTIIFMGFRFEMHNNHTSPDWQGWFLQMPGTQACMSWYAHDHFGHYGTGWVVGSGGPFRKGVEDFSEGLRGILDLKREFMRSEIVKAEKSIREMRKACNALRALGG